MACARNSRPSRSKPETATNRSPGRSWRESWVRPVTIDEGDPWSRATEGSAASNSATRLACISLQFTRGYSGHFASSGTAQAAARQARRVQVLRRQGRTAVCRQGQVAAQPRALVLSEDGNARAAEAADGDRGRRDPVPAGRNANDGAALRGRSGPTRATTLQRQATRRQTLPVHPHQCPRAMAKDDGRATHAARRSTLLRPIHGRDIRSSNA